MHYNLNVLNTGSSKPTFPNVLLGLFLCLKCYNIPCIWGQRFASTAPLVVINVGWLIIKFKSLLIYLTPKIWHTVSDLLTNVNLFFNISFLCILDICVLEFLLLSFISWLVWFLIVWRKETLQRIYQDGDRWDKYGRSSVTRVWRVETNNRSIEADTNCKK